MFNGSNSCPTVRVILCRIRRHTKTAFVETNRFSTNPPVCFFSGWDQRHVERIVNLHHIWGNLFHQKCEMLRFWEKPLTKPNKCCCFYAAVALPSKTLCSGLQNTEGESPLFYDMHPIKISQTKAIKRRGHATSNVATTNNLWTRPSFLRGNLWFKATWKPACIIDPCTNGVQLGCCHSDFSPNTQIGLHRHT